MATISSSPPIKRDDAPPASPSKPGARVAWPHVILSVLGIGAGLYAAYLHALVMAGRATGCGISETISCDKVLGSNYGNFLGIPLGYYGALFWALMLVSSISGATTSPRSAAWQRLGLASVGLATSLVLAWLSLGVLRHFCPVCATTHVLSGINFLFAVWGIRKIKS